MVQYRLAQIALEQHEKRDEETLRLDAHEAIEEYAAHVTILCECGEIGVGLGEKWLEVVCRCCGPGFHVTHQSYYTRIVRESTVEVHSVRSMSIGCGST